MMKHLQADVLVQQDATVHALVLVNMIHASTHAVGVKVVVNTKVNTNLSPTRKCEV